MYMNQQPVLGGSDPTTEPRPNPPYEVHCGRCRWWGYEHQLRTIYKSGEPDMEVSELACPMCLSDYWLEYRE